MTLYTWYIMFACFSCLNCCRSLSSQRRFCRISFPSTQYSLHTKCSSRFNLHEWRRFSCVCFSPLLVLTSVQRRKGGVQRTCTLTPTDRTMQGKNSPFFLCALDVVLKTKYHTAAIGPQKMVWITNDRLERGLIRKQSLLIVKLSADRVWKANLVLNNDLRQDSQRFQKNQQIADLVFYYPEFHTSVDLTLITQNKR